MALDFDTISIPLLNLPLEASSQVVPSLLNLPLETSSQVDPSLLNLPLETSSQVDPSLLNLPLETSSQVDPSLLNLPSEILFLILNYLDARSLSCIRGVSSGLRGLVDGSCLQIRMQWAQVDYYWEQLHMMGQELYN